VTAASVLGVPDRSAEGFDQELSIYSHVRI